MMPFFQKLMGRGALLDHTGDPKPTLAPSAGQGDAPSSASFLQLSAVGGEPGGPSSVGVFRELPVEDLLGIEKCPSLVARGHTSEGRGSPVGDAKMGKGDSQGGALSGTTNHGGATEGPGDGDKNQTAGNEVPTSNRAEKRREPEMEDSRSPAEVDRGHTLKHAVSDTEEEGPLTLEITPEILSSCEGDRLLEGSLDREAERGALSPWRRFLNMYNGLKRSSPSPIPPILPDPNDQEGEPIHITVYGFARPQSKLYQSFKSTDTVGFLEAELKRMLQVSGTSRLWKKGKGEERQLLEKSEITLEQAGITNGQILYLGEEEETRSPGVQTGARTPGSNSSWFSLRRGGAQVKSPDRELMCGPATPAEREGDGDLTCVPAL